MASLFGSVGYVGRLSSLPSAGLARGVVLIIATGSPPRVILNFLTARSRTRLQVAGGLAGLRRWG